MSKYNFDLDMSTDNSNSMILRQIKPNSTVFEFGCAHGRMTKYLKETLNCTVYVSEIDEKSGDQAAKWAEKAFIGKSGDIENENFFNKLNKQKITKFDYIIFADVLEHLYYPEKVLARSANLIKPDGSIWISIPNIAHNAVLIDLWNHKFNYRDVGLLDNTHIRFFTASSLQNMIDKVGLKTGLKFALRNPVGNTEFNNNYSDLPESIRDAFKNRVYGEIYQFVWELKR